MTNEGIMQIAMQQSAIECNCSAEDFLKKDNVIVFSKTNEFARKYLPLPLECHFVSYGNNIVASINEQMQDIVKNFLDKYEYYHCFETPNMHTLNDELQKKGFQVCFMAEYFLPDMRALRELECRYELRVLQQSDLAELYTGEWSNAICEERKEGDVLGVGAYDNGRLIGLAGCSADCDTMYQIGVDVLEEYRQQGIASAITSKLALEIINLGKVPFYCCAWSNIRSVKNAIRSGFFPAWVEMTARSIEFVTKMNQ